MRFLITEPTKGYLDGYNGGNSWEWTHDRSKAWQLAGSEATRKAALVAKEFPLARIEPVKPVKKPSA